MRAKLILVVLLLITLALGGCGKPDLLSVGIVVVYDGPADKYVPCIVISMLGFRQRCRDIGGRRGMQAVYIASCDDGSTKFLRGGIQTPKIEAVGRDCRFGKNAFPHHGSIGRPCRSGTWSNRCD